MYAALVVYALTAVDGSAAVAQPTACSVETRTCQTGTDCVPFANSDEGLCLAETSYLDFAVGRAHICGLVGDGSLECWDVEDRDLFPILPEVGGYVVEVASGSDHVCALLEDGSVACWGHNARGQLGQGSSAEASAPSQVNLGTVAVALAASGDATCVLTESSQLMCWGDNTEGMFGLGTTGIVGDDETPADVGPAPTSAPVVDFSIEDDHVCVETEEGQSCAGKSWSGTIRF